MEACINSYKPETDKDGKRLGSWHYVRFTELAVQIFEKERGAERKIVKEVSKVLSRYGEMVIRKL